MKKFLFPLLITGLACFGALISCSDEQDMNHIQITPVEALYAPEDNSFYNLGAQSNVVFNWQRARAADNGVVLYEVAFDREDGDFSSPLYMVPSGGRGMQASLSMSFSELNTIAQMAGIGPEETGFLQWTVLSSKGVNLQEPQVFRRIEVQRPAGFPAPDELYLTGLATETGEDIESARAMTRTGSNTFEIYTRLEAGDYHFIDRISDNAVSYFIEDERIRIDGSTAYEGDGQVYRIRLDFSNGTVELTQVGDFQLWFAPNGEFMFDLEYAGNGIWTAEDEAIEFKQESWGRDERYKFRLHVISEGQEGEEWYGSVNMDNSRPDGDTDASFWHMVPVSNDHWNNSFKFATEADNSMVDMEIHFNAEVPAYTHQINIK